MVFHWILSDSKSPQVSRTLLSILVDLYNVIVWMLSTGPIISKLSIPGTNPLVTVPRVPITIGIIVTLFVMFWPVDPAKNAIQGDATEWSDTF